jgi:hypothetical protein
MLMLLVAAIGLVAMFRKDRMLAASLLLIGAIGFLLALGASGPFVPFFSMLGDRVPLYLIFRDTQKFVGLLCLAYAWAGAYGAGAIMSALSLLSSLISGVSGISGMISRISGAVSGPRRPALALSGTISIVLPSAALALLLALPILYNYGFFGLLGQIGLSHYPDDWYAAERIIAADPSPTNMMVFPPHLYGWYRWMNASQQTLGMPAGQFFPEPVMSPTSVETQYVQSDTNDPKERYMAFLFSKRQYINDTAEMLLPLNVRYIMLLKDDEDCIHYLYLFTRKGGVKDIELVYEGRTLYLFRNNLAKGPFFASSENGSNGFDTILDDSGKGVYSPDVSYEKTGPASYRVLSSAYEYVVFASRFGRASDVDGAQFSAWHQLDGFWRFSGPAMVVNRVFGVTLALFLLACSASLWLIARLRGFGGGMLLPAGIALLSVIAYLAVASGAAGPAALGALLVLAFAAAIFIPSCPRRGSDQNHFKCNVRKP